MAEEKGIQETLEAALFGAAVGQLVVNVSTGKVSGWNLAGALLPAIAYVENAVDKIGEVPGELADMTDEELTQLRQQVKLQLGLKGKDAINRGVDASLLIARGVAEFVALVRE